MNRIIEVALSDNADLDASVAVAQAYAGHQDDVRGARAMSATGTYVRAGLPEVATALTVLTGESHPLAPEESHPLAPEGAVPAPMDPRN